VNRVRSQSGDGVTGGRTVKLVRLRVGVYATGRTVGRRQPPVRGVHVVGVAVDLDAPEGVIAYCGVYFAPGTLVEVPWGRWGRTRCAADGRRSPSLPRCISPALTAERRLLR
jgi:hypothetical protein